ncbi:hypothetical protein AAVH_31506, partial [Aphelenchoides avenae]
MNRSVQRPGTTIAAFNNPPRRCPQYPDCANANGFCPLGVHPSPKRLCGWLDRKDGCPRGQTCTYFHPLCEKPRCDDRRCVFLHSQCGAPNVKAFRCGRNFVMPRQNEFIKTASAAKAEDPELKSALPGQIRFNLLLLQKMTGGQSLPVQETVSRALKHLDTLEGQIERDRTALAEKTRENDALVALNKETKQTLEDVLSSVEKQKAQAAQAAPVVHVEEAQDRQMADAFLQQLENVRNQLLEMPTLGNLLTDALRIK